MRLIIISFPFLLMTIGQVSSSSFLQLLSDESLKSSISSCKSCLDSCGSLIKQAQDKLKTSAGSSESDLRNSFNALRGKLTESGNKLGLGQFDEESSGSSSSASSNSSSESSSQSGSELGGSGSSSGSGFGDLASIFNGGGSSTSGPVADVFKNICSKYSSDINKLATRKQQDCMIRFAIIAAEPKLAFMAGDVIRIKDGCDIDIRTTCDHPKQLEKDSECVAEGVVREETSLNRWLEKLNPVHEVAEAIECAKVLGKLLGEKFAGASSYTSSKISDEDKSSGSGSDSGLFGFL